MANIAGYIANLGKSVSYAAVDKVKKVSPTTAEFASTNADLFKDLYTNVRDYKVTYKRGMDIFTKSKIYEAGDVLKTSLMEDIKTGKLYNKEREDKLAMKFLGGDMSDGFEDSGSEFNFDDFGDFDFDDSSIKDVTNGDRVVSAMINSSSQRSAEMISTVTARTGEYIVENQKMSTNLLYTQNMQTYSMLNGNLTSINENISNVLNFSDKVIKTHVDNSTRYYQESTKLMQDQTALLREIVTLLKPSKTEEKTKEVITFDDIVGANGAPDLKKYFQNIKKNIAANSGMGMFSSMSGMFGDNSNALAMLAASPLKFIPEAIINTVVPKTIEASMENLDKSMSNMFGSMMVKFNTMANSDDFIASLLGKTLGVRSTAKDSIDTSRYEKGKVDWDGKSRKALIEVIPTLLAKIESSISGQSEKIYDYEKGQFVDAKSIKNELDNKKSSYSKNASSEMKAYMDDYMKLMTFNSMEERKKLQEDMQKFFDKLYSENRLFEVNSATLDQDHMDYGIDAKNFRAIRAMFKKAPKYMQHQINTEILENRQRQTRDFEELEKSGTSVLQYLFNGSNLNEYVKKNNSVLTNSLNSMLDNTGHNIFFYLQNIYRELSFMRQMGRGGNGNKLTDPIKVVGSSGSYIPQQKTINDIQIARKPKKSKQEEDTERKRREEERFRRSELKRREKNGDLINYSEIDDELMLERDLSAMIEVDRIDRRLKLEDSRKPSLIDRLLEAESLSDKTKIMIDKITNVSKKPVEFVTSTIEKVDQRMYEFIYGREDANGNDIKGFLDLTLYELRNTFSKFNTFMDEKILEPLKEKLDVDSFKSGFKKLLGKMGIDTDEINKSIRSFFFGDKETGVDGIFTSTINATKNAFKSTFKTVKDSVSSTLSPAINKGRELFRGKNEFSYLDEISGIEDVYDSEGNIIGQKSNIQQRIDEQIINKNITGKTQAYYDSLNFDTDEYKIYNAKNSYIAGKRTLAQDKAELLEIDEQLKKLKVSLKSTRGTEAKRIANKIKESEARKLFIQNNLKDYSESEAVYKSHLQDKKYDNIKNYYTNSLSGVLGLNEDSEAFGRVMDNLFDKTKSSFTGKDNFTIKDLMSSARELSLNEDEKYESIFNNIANYADKYYGEDIDKRLSVLADDSGKLIDPDNWYRSEGLPTNAEEFYEMFPNLVNSSELLLDEISDTNDQQLPLIKQLADDLRFLKDSLVNSMNSRAKATMGPRVGLNPALLAHPEGGAIQTFSQDLVSMISNWMFGNTPKYDKGGYIPKTTVATIGEGEVVLTAENVEKLTSIFNELVGDIKSRKKSNSDIAQTAFDPLLSMSDELGIKDLSIMDGIIKSNPELNKSIKTMSFTDRRNYNRIVSSISDKLKGVQLDPVQQALYMETRPFVQQMGEELVSGMGAVKRSLFGESEKQESKAFGDVLNDVTGNISKYAPDAIGSGLVGAGVSLLTGAIGGPLLGAAVGAGYSLTKNSDKVQNWLFGESIDGERQGGVINKKIIDIATKYLPDMKSYGITGALAGFFTPLGPIGGLLAGSALGFAKNNESFMSTIFGEEGLFKAESKDKLKKALPKVALGALAGGMVGPFGLLGNLVLGSGLGLAASTDDFKQAILGRYDERDKKFKGGLLPTMRDTIIDPLKSFGTDIKNGAMDYIKQHMILPVSNAIDPIKKEISLIVKGTFDTVGDFLKGMFKETFAPMNKWIEDKIMKPIGGTIVKFIKGTFKVGTGLATLPFKAIGGVGNKLRKKHIKQGNADYMTAEERLAYASEKGIKYNNEFDMYLNSLSDEDATELFDTLSSIDSSRKSVRQLRKDIGTETGNKLSTYVDYDTTKDIMAQIKYGDLDKAKSIITKNKKGLFGRKKRHELSVQEQDKLLSYIDKQYNSFHNVEQSQAEMDNKRYALYDILRKKGFKDIDDNTVDRYLSLVRKEMNSDKRKKGEKPAELVLQVQKENHEEIVNLFKEAIMAIKGIEENTEPVVEREIGSKKKSDEKSLIQELAESQSMTQIDAYGNVIELKRTSDGELEPDMSDSSTARAIKLANEEREEKKSFMDKLTNGFSLFSSKKEDEEDDKKSKGLFGWISDLISGKGKLAALAGLGLMFAPKIIDITKEHVLPAASEMWENGIKPWISEVGIPLFRQGLVEVVKALPSMIVSGVKFGITELIPALLTGMKELIGFGEKDTFGESITDTAIRQVATGGSMSTAGLDTVKNIATKGAKGSSEAVPLATKVGKNLTGMVKSPFFGSLKAGADLAGGIAKGSVKFGAKVVGKAAETVGSVYNKIDNVSIKGNSLKSFSESIQSKFTSGVEAIGTSIVKFSQEDTIIKSAIDNMSSFFSKLLTNQTVTKILGSEITEKLTKTFVPNFLEQFGKAAVANAGKMGAKVGGAFLTGGILNMVFAVTDFVSGYNDAKNILGITNEPTLGMKVASGLLKSINGLFIITSLIPEKVYVDLLLDTLLPIFGKDDSKLQEMRKEAQVKAKEYAKENNISGTFTVRDYNNKVKEENKKLNPSDRNGDGKVSTLEKVVNFGSNAVNKVKQFGSNVWNNTKNFLFGKGGSTSSAGMGSAGKGGNSSTTYPSRMNNFTYYSQVDPRWNSQSIGGTSVKVAGCGPTSMAMIVSELTGQAHRPDDFVKDAYNTGHWTKNGAQWTLFKYFADKYNLPYQEAGTYKRFQEMAAAGIPQAVSGRTNGVQGSPFTSGGHIITVLGMDANGNYIVNDPVSAARSKSYSNDIIQKGWRNSWGFGAAGTYDPSKANSANAAYANGTADTTTITQESTQSGLSALFNDFASTATNTFNKIYGFDEINQQSVSSAELAGMGGVIDDKTEINPLAATEFEDMGTVTKIKGALKKVGNILTEFKPIKVTADVINKAKKSLTQYNGMGGVDGTATVKTIKNIPIGSKPLNEKVKSYDSIFRKAGAEFGIDPDLLMAICMQESKGEDIRKAARGLMQIENGGTTKEFINFGKTRSDGPYNEADRSNPSKAIPFAAKRLASDFAHYSGDYLKTTQAYNFSKYSLDKLLKAFPNGDEWLSQRSNVGKYNGTGKSRYGDPKYIEHVFQYYQGNQIPSDGIGTVTGGSGVESTATAESTEQRSGFEGLMADLGDLLTGGFNKLYGLDEILGTTTSATGEVSGESSDPNAAGINTSTSKVADDWFVKTLGGRMTSAYGNRIHPISKKKTFHRGIDYGTASGTAIKSPVDGTVVSSLPTSQTGGFGNLLKLKDNSGSTHYFAHMLNKSSLKSGDRVKIGDTVGKVGSTGNSTGPHLHYEIRTGSAGSNDHTEPNNYLSKLFKSLPSNANVASKTSASNGKGGVDGKAQPVKRVTLPAISRSSERVTNTQQSEGLSDSKLLGVIINILSKIADNTSSLSEIVQLLSQALNVDIPQESIDKMKDNNNSVKGGNKQIVNIIKNSIKDNKNPDNEYLLKTLESLAIE